MTMASACPTSRKVIWMKQSVWKVAFAGEGGGEGEEGGGRVAESHVVRSEVGAAKSWYQTCFGEVGGASQVASPGPINAVILSATVSARPAGAVGSM